VTIRTDPSTGNSAIPILRAWDDRSICHGFAGRIGGVGVGRFESLNLSYFLGDQKDSVDRNWELLRAQLPALGEVALVNQVHGIDVRRVDAQTCGERPDGDGMVATGERVLLGIFTADCVPILMVDRAHRVVGALHAGWRGLIGGFVGAGIRAMTEAGAALRDLQVAMGPSIGLCCFEVDSSLADRFAREIPGAVRHRRAGLPGKAYIDLRGIVNDQFEAAGIALDNILSVGPCSKCESNRFFSRRAAGGKQTGVQLSFIGLTA
jgi:polyphenol oxidase